MAKITVDIAADPEYVSGNEGEYDRWEQYLTVTLRNYFPKLIIEHLDEMPYLEDLEITQDDVEATYRVDPQAWEGYMITLYIDKARPQDQMTWVLVRTHVRQAVFDWFRSKDFTPFRMSLDIEWKED